MSLGVISSFSGFEVPLSSEWWITESVRPGLHERFTVHTIMAILFSGVHSSPSQYSGKNNKFWSGYKNKFCIFHFLPKETPTITILLFIMECGRFDCTNFLHYFHPLNKLQL